MPAGGAVPTAQSTERRVVPGQNPGGREHGFAGVSGPTDAGPAPPRQLGGHGATRQPLPGPAVCDGSPDGRNTEDAADLVQETFVRAMQGLARFEGKSSLYTWLFRIAINLSISHRRSRSYRAAVSLDGDREEEDRGGGINTQAAGLRRQLAQDTEDDPAISAERRLEYERLMDVLSRLDPEFMAVIVLRDVEECDYEQMAAILDVPVGTIKSRLFRARVCLARGAIRPPLKRESA